MGSLKLQRLNGNSDGLGRPSTIQSKLESVGNWFDQIDPRFSELLNLVKSKHQVQFDTSSYSIAPEEQ